MNDPGGQQLWELFIVEGLAKVQQVRDLVGQLAQGPPQIRKRLAAALEALEAASALMGVPEVSALAAAAKQAVLEAADAPALAASLTTAAERLELALHQLQTPDASGARVDPAPLQQSLQALRALAAPAAPPAVQPAPEPDRAGDQPERWVPQVDDDMVEPFLEECNERLASLAEELVQLESTQDPELVRSVFRDLHTLKGSSGFVGLVRMNRLAHAAEDVVGELRDGRRAPGRPVIDALLAALDGLRAILDRAAAGVPIDVPIEPLIARLRAPDAPVAAAVESPPAEPAAGAVAAPPPEPAAEAGQRAAGLTLRVDFDKLDQLLNLVGELVLGKARIHELRDDLHGLSEKVNSDRQRASADAAAGNGPTARRAQVLERLSQELETATGRLDTVSARLREQVMKLRMVPIAGLFNKYRRVVRDLSHGLEKEVELEIRGADTELDKLLVEQLDDPLLHLVRNAVDHGIEVPSRREAAGKPPRGRLLLQASHRGHQIVIEIADDGAGIDPSRVAAKALDRGLVTPEEVARLEGRQLLELIFLPGLSTAGEVTGLSGRGVGMDVVREAIASLKGSIDIESTVGQGTRFILKLPLTLAISNVLLCRAGGQVLAVPIHAVKHTLIASPDPAQTRHVAARPTLRLDGEVPLIDVARTLGLSGATARPPFPVALVESLGGTFGLIFDELLGRQEIVIKSLGSLLERVPCCAGATLLGERCALILDVPALVRRALETPQGLAVEETTEVRLPTVLVVEDSDTVREDLRRLLAAAGFAVQEARDGAEALQLAGTRRFDLVSTDVMMPGMDGYELCRQLRRLPAYENVPIIMLTSRDQEIDRIRGFDAGVDAYLVKPVDRTEMTALARRLLEGAPAAEQGGEP